MTLSASDAVAAIFMAALGYFFLCWNAQVSLTTPGKAKQGAKIWYVSLWDYLAFNTEGNDFWEFVLWKMPAMTRVLTVIFALLFTVVVLGSSNTQQNYTNHILNLLTLVPATVGLGLWAIDWVRNRD